MGIYVKVNKISDDGRLVRYSFESSDGSERTVVVDRQEDRLWPEDGIKNIEYNGAALAIVKAWRQQGELPNTALHQA